MPDALDKYAVGNDGLSNNEIATLVDIAQSGEPAQARSPRAGGSPAQRPNKDAELARLLAFGFVEPDEAAADGTPRYQLTPAGEQFLGARGAGLNEA